MKEKPRKLTEERRLDFLNSNAIIQGKREGIRRKVPFPPDESTDEDEDAVRCRKG
jgi:hypothetical protein